MRIHVSCAAVRAAHIRGRFAADVFVPGLIGAAPEPVLDRWRTVRISGAIAARPAVARPAVTRAATGWITIARLTAARPITVRAAVCRTIVPRPAIVRAAVVRTVIVWPASARARILWPAIGRRDEG